MLKGPSEAMRKRSGRLGSKQLLRGGGRPARRKALLAVTVVTPFVILHEEGCSFIGDELEPGGDAGPRLRREEVAAKVLDHLLRHAHARRPVPVVVEEALEGAAQPDPVDVVSV